MRGGVYCLKDSCGKYYVGQSKDIDKRFAEHRAKRTNSTKDLYNSNEVFEEKVLFLSDCSYEKTRMEQFYINYYNSLNDGYNMCQAGAPTFEGKKHSLENRKRWSETRKGIEPKKAVQAIRKQVYCGYNGTLYESITACARDLNFSQALMSMMLNGKRENRYNLEFK